MVRRYMESAEWARRRADAATDRRIRQDFLDVERHWLNLVQSEQFSERLNLFCSTLRKTGSERSRSGGRDGRAVQREPLVSLVDDEEIVRGGMSALIEALGYKTASFSTAEEFLTSTVRQRTSVLISDVQLPGMSGPDLQEALLAEGHRFPIIFMTGFPNEQVRTRTLKAGALGFLTKPCKEAFAPLV